MIPEFKGIQSGSWLYLYIPQDYSNANEVIKVKMIGKDLSTENFKLRSNDNYIIEREKDKERTSVNGKYLYAYSNQAYEELCRVAGFREIKQLVLDEAFTNMGTGGKSKKKSFLNKLKFWK